MKRYLTLTMFLVFVFPAFSQDNQDNIIISGGGAGSGSNKLAMDYQKFVNQQGQSDFSWARDENIYRAFVESREVIEQHELENLFNYWSTDLSTPAKFERYQADGLNWEVVKSDIEEAMFTVEARAGSLTLPEDAVYKHQGRLYFNPYVQGETMWFKNNSHVEMERVREMFSPSSFVDISAEKIDGFHYQNIKELPFAPQSYNLDKMFPSIK